MFVSLIMVATVLLSSCSKDDDNGPGQGSEGYSRNVSIEYRVTSATGLGAANITYFNETGGMATVDNAVLPATIKISRSIKQFDGINVGATSTVGGELKTEILVDGKVVESKSFSGTSVVVASTTYVFP